MIFKPFSTLNNHKILYLGYMDTMIVFYINCSCDQQLSDWVILTLERRKKLSKLKLSSQILGTMCLGKRNPASPGIIRKSFNRLVTFFIDTVKVGLYHLTMLKGLFLYSILQHASNKILRHRFETVGGYDMEKLSYYVVFVVVSSKITIGVMNVLNWKSLDGYCFNRTNRSWILIKMCVILFPFHFSTYELRRHQTLKRLQEYSLIHVLDMGKNKEVAVETKDQFRRTSNMVNELNDSTILANKMHIHGQILTTIFERLPLCVILAAMYLACKGKFVLLTSRWTSKGVSCPD